jgi:hypothetical protein
MRAKFKANAGRLECSSADLELEWIVAKKAKVSGT